MARKIVIVIVLMGGVAALSYVGVRAALRHDEPPIKTGSPPSFMAATHPAGEGIQFDYVPAGMPVAPTDFTESLTAVAIDDRGWLYAAGDGQVKVFDHCDTPKPADGFTPASEPLSLAIDAAGNIYVGEAGRIEKFARRDEPREQRSAETRPAIEVKPLAVIGAGVLTGKVSGLAVCGDVLVAAEYIDEPPHGLIQLFKLSGEPLGPLGGEQPISFRVPLGRLDVAANADGRAVVAHSGHFSVDTYGLDGGLLAQWGRSGTIHPEDFTPCCNPVSVAVTPDGFVVVADKAPSRVKLFDPAGHMVAYIGPEYFSAESRKFDLAVDPGGRIYVADPQARTVRRFLRKQ